MHTDDPMQMPPPQLSSSMQPSCPQQRRPQYALTCLLAQHIHPRAPRMRTRLTGRMRTCPARVTMITVHRASSCAVYSTRHCSRYRARAKCSCGLRTATALITSACLQRAIIQRTTYALGTARRPRPSLLTRASSGRWPDTFCRSARHLCASRRAASCPSVLGRRVTSGSAWTLLSLLPLLPLRQ